MKIDKTCKTCKYCFKEENKRTCASAYYGEEITDFETDRDCWEIGIDYWFTLQEKLTNDEIAILNGYMPSLQKREFKKLGVKNEDEYLIKLASER